MTCLEREFKKLAATTSPSGSTEAPAPSSIQLVMPHVGTVRACLKSMVGTSSFMTMCINRSLDYTKASKGVKLVPKPETVNLQEALDFPISIMRDVQTQLPITLAPVPAEICSHIITDKQWLMENVLCLLSNAVRYSQAGSVDVRILFQPPSSDGDVSDGHSICIEVWDTGIGLPESVMATLFAPFKQAQRLAGGTGLGLFSLAKRVEALHGRYGVCKRPDTLQGSMFWFSIPYRPDNVSSSQAPRHLSPAVSISPRTSLSPHVSRANSLCIDSPRWKVLVVDDAPSILKMTTMLLTKKGHVVETAVNGAEAVLCVGRASGKDVQKEERIDAAPYDVVLMDLQMPVMDGIEAIRRIRAEEKKRTMSAEVDLESGSRKRQLIIALSANSDSETMQEALDAGADSFLSKPFKYETFHDYMEKQRGVGVE
jgi:CheY-like chemotaxis protein